MLKSIVVSQENIVYEINDCQGTITNSGGDFDRKDCTYNFNSVDISEEIREIPYKFNCHLENDVTIKIKKESGEEDTIKVLKDKTIETFFKVDRETNAVKFGEVLEFLRENSDNGTLESGFGDPKLPPVLHDQVSGRHKAKVDDVGLTNNMYTIYFEFPKVAEPHVNSLLLV